MHPFLRVSWQPATTWSFDSEDSICIVHSVAENHHPVDSVSEFAAFVFKVYALPKSENPGISFPEFGLQPMHSREIWLSRGSYRCACIDESRQHDSQSSILGEWDLCWISCESTLGAMDSSRVARPSCYSKESYTKKCWHLDQVPGYDDNNETSLQHLCSARKQNSLFNLWEIEVEAKSALADQISKCKSYWLEDLNIKLPLMAVAYEGSRSAILPFLINFNFKEIPLLNRIGFKFCRTSRIS
jgi:hypothetical protein